MRTPPPIRTWGQPPAEIVIRQSAPIKVDEAFEEVAWRGMELFEGWLMPKGAGLSNEEKQLDAELCARTLAKLESHLAGCADLLANVDAAAERQLEVGYLVFPTLPYDDDIEAVERGFSLGYREIWAFHPWYRILDVHTSPSDKQRVRGELFESPHLKRGSEQLPLSLSDIWED